MRANARITEGVSERRGDDDRASLAPPVESIPPPPVARVAPSGSVPPRSVEPNARGLAPRRAATKDAKATTSVAAVRGRDPGLWLALTIAVIGAVDFVIPLLAWGSVPLSAILTVLVVPWAI